MSLTGAGEGGRGSDGAPFRDIAALASFAAGASACVRSLDGRVLGTAGALDAASYDLEPGVAVRERVVPDVTRDRELAAHPAVRQAPYVRAWARFPIERSGVTLGSLDIADVVPRVFADDRRLHLLALARQAALVMGDGEPAWVAALAHLRLPVFVLRLEDAGSARLVDGNPAARRLAPPGSFGASFEEIFPWADARRVLERCARVGGTGTPEDLEVPLALGPGAQLVYALRIFPLPDGLVGVSIEEVTDHAEIRRKGEEFVTVVSHELRTPLATIRGAVGLLESGVGGPLPAGSERIVGLARDGCERMGRMLDQLLAAERLRAALLPLRSASLSVAELVSTSVGAVTPAARASNIAIDVQVRQDGRVFGDRERLAQALTNLLSNAVRFSPAGGTVRVDVARPLAERVCVQVADEGAALAPEDARQAFTPQRGVGPRSAGPRAALGLGLVNSRFIVEGHGGTIGVRPGPERGAVFWFELPILADLPAALSSPA